jgi:hypothetical protein
MSHNYELMINRFSIFCGSAKMGMKAQGKRRMHFVETDVDTGAERSYEANLGGGRQPLSHVP